MYVLYLDESGDPTSWQTNKCYVLGGVAVFEGEIRGLTNQLADIQARYFQRGPMPIQFHITDIRKGRNCFGNLPFERRQELISDVYSVITRAGFPSLVAFATAIDRSSARGANQARRVTFEDVTNRFNYFLVRQHKGGHTEKGLLIIDENRAEQYREIFSEFQEGGTRYGYLGNVPDVPYFARCRDSRMLQLADFVANAVYRYYQHGDDFHIKNILPCFDRRSIDYPPDGLKHIIRGPCNCIACEWRNRF
jgi:hypothetical protein